ncbi:MAG TPA: serine hydrolase, partial [Caulobacteraceae bacterium]
MPDDASTLQTPTQNVTEQLDALFAPWRRTDEPGLVVGVVKDGRLIYRRAFGMASLEHAVANTPATRMRIGSISKHFT